jgi:hypothetical protein
MAILTINIRIANNMNAYRGIYVKFDNLPVCIMMSWTYREIRVLGTEAEIASFIESLYAITTVEFMQRTTTTDNRYVSTYRFVPGPIGEVKFNEIMRIIPGIALAFVP